MLSSNFSVKSEYHELRALSIVTLLSIATIIGSGILALPVTLFQTSVSPFLFLFTLSALAQIAAITVVVELIQRARVATNTSAPQLSYESIPSNSDQSSHQPPDISLFTLAQLYLPNLPSRIFFYLFTYIGFIAVIISYALAGPQAFWQLVIPKSLETPPPAIVVALYWAIGSGSVVFFLERLLGLFGFLTVLKGTLFTAVVFIVAFLPPAAHISSVPRLLSDFSGWHHSIVPFLISCVALSGLPNTMPVTFKLLPINATSSHIRNFRTAVILAVVICYLLNVGWVLAVLQVVPRNAPNGAPSLTNAYHLGQISTVPLIDVLHHTGAVHGSLLHTVEVIVELFIFASTGVSFFVMSAGLKSFVDGGLHCMNERYQAGPRSTLIRKFLAYMASFGAILCISLANPNGFIDILIDASSFALCFQAGLMLFVMLYNSRTARLSEDSIISQERESSSSLVSSDAGWGKTGNDVEKSERRLNTCHGCVPLEMSRLLSTSCIVYGVLFFLTACCLAGVAPFIGISSHSKE